MADNNEPARSEVLGGELSRVSPEDRSQELASPEAVSAFQDRFLRLIERRTALYTMGESTSVPKHVAVDLLRSVCFVLGIDPDDPTVPDRLLTADLEAEYQRSLAEIERKVELTRKLWQEACLTTPLIENIALRDTLITIGEFPKNYDYRSMAHECACMIDYQLCHPVPATLLGVDYINEYLRRLLIESDFLQRFDLELCKRLLSASCPDYVGLLINLYEPVAANAIGLALVGKDPHPLEVTDDDRAEIVRRLVLLGHAARERALREAAAAACDSLGVCDDAARQYLADWAADLLPRIELGLSRQELRGVFVAF